MMNSRALCIKGDHYGILVPLCGAWGRPNICSWGNWGLEITRGSWIITLTTIHSRDRIRFLHQACSRQKNQPRTFFSPFVRKRAACTWILGELSYGLSAEQKVPFSRDEVFFWPRIGSNVEKFFLACPVFSPCSLVTVTLKRGKKQGSRQGRESRQKHKLSSTWCACTCHD